LELKSNFKQRKIACKIEPEGKFVLGIFSLIESFNFQKIIRLSLNHRIYPIRTHAYFQVFFLARELKVETSGVNR